MKNRRHWPVRCPVSDRADIQRLDPLRLTALSALALAACAPEPEPEPSIEDQLCTDEVFEVAFDAADPIYPEVHAAIAELPGTHVNQGTYYDLGTTTEVTTTIDLAGTGYTLTPHAINVGCLITLEIPVHVRAESEDGWLSYDEHTMWGESSAIFPDALADDIVLGAKYSTAAFPSWVEVELAEVWPEIVEPDDGGELALHIDQQRGELLFGELSYVRKTVTESQTVIWSEAVLLAWGPAPPSAGP